MTSRYSENFKLIDWSDFRPLPSQSRGIKDRPAFHIMRDIDPFISPVTDEVIGGRRQKREHMREHGLEEVGNERPKPHGVAPVKMPPAAPDIAMEMKRRGIIG